MSTEPGRARSAIALALLVPAPTLGVLAAMIFWPGTALGKALYMAGKVVILGLPVVWNRAVDHQPLSWSPPKKGGFGLAVGLGLLIAATIVGTYWLVARHWIDADMMRTRLADVGLDTPQRYLLMGAWITVGNALLEEYVWRWFVFRKCEILVGGLPAVFLSAACFTLHHVFAMQVYLDLRTTILASIGVFCGGAIWSFLYLRTRSVWPCYVSHVIADAAIIAVGYHLLFAG